MSLSETKCIVKLIIKFVLPTCTVSVNIDDI